VPVDERIVAISTIVYESPDRVVLVQRNFGDLGIHVFIAVLIAW